MPSNLLLERIRILIADDEPAILDVFRRVLSHKDVNRQRLVPEPLSDDFEAQCEREHIVRVDTDAAELVFCRQGLTAVDLVHRACEFEAPFAVAFLDVRMPPGQNGVRTAEAIRKLDDRIHFVFVTAYDDVHPFEMSRMAPPSDKVFYLQKPFRTEEIQQLASALTTKWRIEREVYQALDLMKTEARNLATELCSEKDRFNSFKKLTTEREIRMSAMKGEINDLLAELGRPARYD